MKFIRHIGPIGLIGLIGLIGYMVAPLSAHASALLKPANNLGLIGYWSMEDATGTSVTDFSGNGGTGVASGSPTWVSGKHGKALNFNGTNQQVSLSYAPDVSTTDTLTISAWVFPNSYQSNAGDPDYGQRAVVDSAGNSPISSDAHGIGIATSNGLANGYINWDGGVGTINRSNISGNAVPLSTWSHIVFTAGGGVTRLYQNGIETASSTYTDAGLYNPTGWKIGKFKIDALGGYFDGKIDEVRIYSRVLSATEITALYNTGAAKLTNANNRGLMGYWSFNDATGTQATDFSGNGNTGTLLPSTSTPTWVGGKRGGALSFDRIDDYVEATTTMNLDASGTISLWMNPTSLDTGNSVLFSKGGEDVNAGRNGVFITTRSNYAVSWHLANSSTEQTVDISSVSFNVGDWHHITLTWDGGHVVTYVDGAQVDSTVQTITPTTTVHPIRIGDIVASGANRRPFGGIIDEVRVYNRTLSAAEVSALYNSGSAKLGVAQNNVASGKLVFWHTFDGKNLSTTTSTDTSGQGYNGTLTGATGAQNKPQPIRGKIGQGLNFDGTDDYVDLGTPAGLSGLDNMTISAWAKMNATSSQDEEVVIAKTDGGSQNDYVFVLEAVGGTPRNFRITFGNGSSSIAQVDALTNITLGQWYFVTATIDNSNVNLYIDGVFSTSTARAGGRPVNSFNAGLSIGRYGSSANYRWNGPLDDVRIYNVALTADEVKRLYNGGR